MSSPRQDTGHAIEADAESHLVAAGLTTLARNVTCRMGEIDLVMRDRGALVFVEVRFRRGASHGGAAASVTHAKRARLVAAARWYLMRNPHLGNVPCRFDVVAVEGDGAARRLEWLRDAFRIDS
ncbi:MAG TPA: YraN family protein [Candidatus Saccharimonadia bacterium]|nr:YraN family protein [Candidatus Saccharimonadia bacterium]